MLSFASLAIVQPTPSMTVAELGLAGRSRDLDRDEAGAGRLTRVLTAGGRPVPGDEPGDEGAVAVAVLPWVVATGQVDAVDHAPGEVRQRLDAGVEHRDVDAGPRVALRPHPGGARLLGELVGRRVAGRAHGSLDADVQVRRDHDARNGVEERHVQRIELCRGRVDERQRGADLDAEPVEGVDDGPERPRRRRDDVLGRAAAEQSGLGRRRRQRHDRRAQRGNAGENDTPQPHAATTRRVLDPTMQEPQPHVSPSPKGLRFGR